VTARLDGRAIRRLVLEASARANVGHVGCSLSVADLVAVLFRSVLRGKARDDPDRDRFVLSKGHAALAVYAALALEGVLPAGALETFGRDGTLLGVHPDRACPGIDFTTGSLGHGLSTAAGAALAARLQRSGRRVVALLSDAECDAGSTWEAALFAGHHRLDALTAVVDRNGRQALGATRDVLDLEPLADKWRAFRWDVHEVDGHDEAALERVLLGPCRERGAPHVVLADTVFGRGVSFMEGRLRWHYAPMTAEEFAAALAEVSA
jgi:transketolase